MMISGALEQALPASATALKAFLMHLVMVGYSGASFTGFVEAIIDSHRQWGFDMAVPIKTLHGW
eukprot:833076-Rhodomonas_salina.2